VTPCSTAAYQLCNGWSRVNFAGSSVRSLSRLLCLKKPRDAEATTIAAGTRPTTYLTPGETVAARSGVTVT
jgi:hypothetical protein